MKNSAESRGVRWDSHVQELEATPELLKIQAALENPSVKYPDYYLKPFHAYTTGNLEWLAAYEVEPATYAMGIRTFKAHPDWSAEKCFVVMRESITDAMKAYMKQHNLAEPKTLVDMGCSTLVDMGCSVGMSTQWMAQAWPSAAAVTGLDLSTYMLAVAEWNRRQLSKPNRQGIQARIFPDGSRLAPITYVHGVAENSPFADASVDLCAFNFVTHECPQHAMEDFCREAARIVKPGGLLTFVDNNPKSKTIQNLPPAIFTLMKSTEPWSDEYYAFDLEAAMRKEGFQEVVTVEADHRHRVVMGYKPAAN
ncbi:hypothetical protein HYH03_004469 [Edaphochlamys debaryana]|uniref:Methyltransferase type 11 domain-containing protein n=1 Tax=Edaphochlamys debaryana TaxID=47281 RepID=A0A835YHI0_9CHLO|nr:hypothetical protein HYH03_004469 [Edaphochlamys debaryana]|eukprot:KAG2497734.1 hypothetical protein HYH03_004469 [Edaphochlamys debaryana]